MCGITGFLNHATDQSAEELCARVRAMATTLIHRGPDDSGEWTDAAAGAALAFRRLAILDLSPAGHQPMASASGRYITVYNGEVYNFQALRAELEAAGQAPQFRGHSDTEVILACVEAWGLEAAVRRFVGMFAMALWDRQKRVLHLVRDRLGVKPLYYGQFGRTLVFGSELKSLRAHPAFRADIDRNALALYLRHNYVPGPYSIYRGVWKLPPGTILSVPLGTTSLPAPVAYWSAREVAERGVAAPFSGDEREAVDRLDALLREAVGLRMIADVPLGVFLSGGIDSSTVAALMQAQNSRPVKTFSIGFEDRSYNEAPFARSVAEHLGTDHTELILSAEEAMAVIPKLPSLFDEPFADSSQIPTYLVSELARRSVTVSLSGDGGDELFGGYERYFQANQIWDQFCTLPGPVRRMAASTLRAASPLVARGLGQTRRGTRMARLAELIPMEQQEHLYHGLISHWKDPASVVRDACEPLTPLTDPQQQADLLEFTHRMMYLDTVTYLPNDILVKVDRASMGVSLEAREPLLDHRVLEFAWTLPLGMKTRGGQGKWALRQVLYRYVPSTMIDRPKMGFGIPLDGWLRGSLRDWAESLLAERRLESDGFFDPEPIRRRWRQHLSGQQNWHFYLWDVLMFQAWWEAQ